MGKYHHQKLPDYSTLLSGHSPPDDIGFTSNQLQIWFNKTNESWIGEGEISHMHKMSDECFIVLQGSLDVDVEGDLFTIKAGEFCCFPAGIYHSVKEIHLPIETLMIRAPSIEDKVYQVEKDDSSVS